MNNPPLVSNGTSKCQVEIVDGGQCPHEKAFWVGPEKTNGIDDYVEVCADHIDSVRREDDIVLSLPDYKRVEPNRE